MTRVAVYLRKSSESDDKQCLSLPAQRAWALDRCAQLGLLEPLIFEEAQSAKLPGRPEFNRMMGLVEKGVIDTIVTWKSDRLARNAADAGRIVFALESRHLKEIVTADGPYRADADSEFMLGLLLSVSAKYSKDLSKNIRRGMEEKWRRGEWTGHAPIGYKNVRQAADRSVIEIDPVLAPYVQQLFHLAATGNHSVMDLAVISRDQWRVDLSSYRRDGRKRGFSPSAVHRILRNEFYYGAMRVKGQLYAGSHPPLITKASFDHVQAILTGRRTLAERPHHLAFAYTGLIRCSLCGRRLVGYKKEKRGKVYRYYACSKHLRGLCPQPQLNERQIEEAVSTVLTKLAIDRQEYELVKKMLLTAGDEERSERLVRQERVERELAQIEKQHARLVDLIVEGSLARPDYDRKQREVAEKRAELTLELRAPDGAPAWLEPMESFFSGLLQATSVFSSAGEDTKRRLIRLIGLELEAQGKTALVHAGRPATMVMHREGHPLGWWLVDNIRNYFTFRSNIEPLLQSLFPQRYRRKLT